MLSGKIISLRRVVVTGMGLISPLGNSVSSSWNMLLAGHSGIARISRFAADLEEFRKRYNAPDDFPIIAGEVKDFDFKALISVNKPDLTKEDIKLSKYTDKFTQYALIASYEAISQSGLNAKAEDPKRLGTIIASGMGGVASLGGGYWKIGKRRRKKSVSLYNSKTSPEFSRRKRCHQYRRSGPNYRLIKCLRRRRSSHWRRLPVYPIGGSGCDARRRSRSSTNFFNHNWFLSYGCLSYGIQ